MKKNRTPFSEEERKLLDESGKLQKAIVVTDMSPEEEEEGFPSREPQQVRVKTPTGEFVQTDRKGAREVKQADEACLRSGWDPRLAPRVKDAAIAPDSSVNDEVNWAGQSGPAPREESRESGAGNMDKDRGMEDGFCTVKDSERLV